MNFPYYLLRRSILSTGEFNRTHPGGNLAAIALDHARKSFAERDEHAVPRAALRSPLGFAFICRRIARMRLPCSRSISRKRESVAIRLSCSKIGGVNRADQRLDQPVERLAAQTAANEGGHALVFFALSRRNEIFHRRTEFAQRAQNRRDGQRPHLRGGHHQKAVGQAMQTPAADHERPPIGRIGLNELIFQAQPFAKIDAPGNGRDEIIRAPFDLKAVAMHGRKHPAHARTGFEKRDRASRIQFHRPMRRRQPGNSAADDRDPRR